MSSSSRVKRCECEEHSECHSCGYIECDLCKPSASNFSSVFGSTCISCERLLSLKSDILVLHALEKEQVPQLYGRYSYIYVKFLRDPTSLTETEIDTLLISNWLKVGDILQ